MSARRTCLGLVVAAVLLSCLPGETSAQLFRRRVISSTFAPRGPSNPCGNPACRMCYPAGSASVCTTGNCQVMPILDQVVRDVEDDAIPPVPTATEPAPPSADPTGPLAPTPPDVVELMLAVAGVTDQDVVYDVGCGDGRALKMAATEYGARCVGFELDPDRAIEAICNCRGLDVTICFGDSRDADWSEATVFVVYMTPEFLAETAQQMSHARTVVSFCHEVPGMDNRMIKFRGHVVYLATPTTEVASGDWSMLQ